MREPRPVRLRIAMMVAFCTVMTAGVQGADEPVMSFSVTCELGEDLGQSPGSLFEASTMDERFVLGAGFCDVYNTHFRSDRTVVQFFVRPTDGEREYALEPLPKPTPDAGTYILGVRGELIAAAGHSATDVRVWDPPTGRWATQSGVTPTRMRLGKGTLAYGDSMAWYDGELILEHPERGSYERFYYANGHLFFYHRYAGDESGYREYVSDEHGFSKLHACPWRPGDGPIDPSDATVLTLKYVGETTFSWGQAGGDALTCSNLGGIYRFDGDAWRTIREPQLGVSYQVYTIIPFYDRVLLGQYPLGEFVELVGDKLVPLDGWPPRIEGASPSAREAQTAMIWGGELLVGVWPWAELWRYSPDAQRWTSMGRMFSQPEVAPEPVHPWEIETAEAGLVHNQWGQRLTSMVPLDARLMLSTSAKSPVPAADVPEFLNEEQLAEYGAVYGLRMPGCISAPIYWSEGPTILEFIVTRERIAILQHGMELASAPIAPALARALAQSGGVANLRSGTGVFGPYGGRSVEARVR